jgi:hypothetical protein
MQYNKLVACVSAAVLAGAIACSNNSDNPISPSSAQPGAAAAGPSGETLKATAPTPQSPVNNQQPQGFLTLVATKATSPFSSSAAAFQYEFEIRRGGNPVAACTQTIPPGPDSTVSYSPTCSLDFDQAYSWRVRAVFQGRQGPWSAEATFRAPAGGFFRNNEFFDPLTGGTSVGEMNGSITFIPGVGARMDGFSSRITYALDSNLQAGEFSLMATGIDEGNDGDKTKVMSMQEGFGELTSNDYRMTVEKRGRRYETPGAVTWRIIMGDADEHNGRIFDGARLGVSLSDEKWYLWTFTWGNGRAELIVREDGPNGRVIYNTSRGTGGFAYRPVPHVVHIGGTSRAGEGDATVPGMIVKNVWFSASPRPNGL